MAPPSISRSPDRTPAKDYDMNQRSAPHAASAEAPAAVNAWLTRYYFLRAAVAAVWVALAFLLGKDMPVLAGALLVAYPAWDAAANFTDAQHSGGLGRNPSQSPEHRSGKRGK
jgi:hypothetical protein